MKKYLMEKVYIYHVFTWHQQCLFNTNSTNSDVPSRNSDMIFEVIVVSKNYNRFDSLNIYWEKFGARKENLRKCFGYFEIQHIDNLSFITVAENPKEYYKASENNFSYKKHKVIKKGSLGMGFEN